jgi:hypothetical protein
MCPATDQSTGFMRTTLPKLPEVLRRDPRRNEPTPARNRTQPVRLGVAAGMPGHDRPGPAVAKADRSEGRPRTYVVKKVN